MAHSGLQRKVSQILSSNVRVESADMAAALAGLSQFQLFVDQPQGTLNQHGIHAAQSALADSRRKQLPSLLERQRVSLNQELLAAFQEVRDELKAVEAVVQDLGVTCEDLAVRFKKARQVTSELVEKTSALQKQKQMVDARHAVVTTFLQRFQLTPQEVAALEGEEISKEYFAALIRIGEIRSECRELLSSDQHHQRIGLDIMDSLTKRLESGYEKLYKYVQKQAREIATGKIYNKNNPNADAENNNPITEFSDDQQAMFVTALRLLKPMPVYYERCCQEIAQSRRVVLQRKFMTALTRGGPNGMAPRPIELQAHDPIRYVSDMLAWIHQQVASEREFFNFMLSTSKDDDGGKEKDAADYLLQLPEESGSGGDGGGGGEVKMNVDVVSPSSSSSSRINTAVLLSEVFEGVAKPLRVRVENSLAVQQPTEFLKCEIAYKMLNVLDFYSDTVGPLFFTQPTTTPTSTSSTNSNSLGRQSLFLETLNGLVRQARQAFFDQIKQLGDGLKANPPPSTHDLSPSRGLLEVVSMLDAIISSETASPVAPSPAREEEFTILISYIIDPLLEAAAISVGGKPSGTTSNSNSNSNSNLNSQFDASDQAVYLINLISAIQAVLKKRTQSGRGGGSGGGGGGGGGGGEATFARMETLNLALYSHLESLVQHQSSLLLRKCGLADKLDRIREYNKPGGGNLNLTLNSGGKKPPLSDLPGMDANSVAASIQAFYGSLFALGTFVMPQCDRILAAHIRRKCREDVGRVVSGCYSTIYNAVIDPTNGYPTPASIVVHTPQQIDTLMDIKPPS